MAKPEAFGRYMKETRKQAGLTMRKAAEEIGVSFAYISQVEHGHRQPPRPKVLVRFAAPYGVDPYALLVQAGYHPDPGKREERWMKKDWDAIMEHPSIRDSLLKPKSVSEAFAKFYQAFASYLRATAEEIDTQPPPKEEIDSLLQEALKDPLLINRQKFPDPPELSAYAKALISELYYKWKRSRESRESFMNQYIRGITKSD